MSFFGTFYFFFSKLLKNNLVVFFKKNRTPYLFTPPESLRFLLLHLKNSSVLNPIQSLDFFSYQDSLSTTHLLCYVFFLPNLGTSLTLLTTAGRSKTWIPSIEDLFFNFWWLEREVSELSGVFFFSKGDSRNLLLEFGNFSKPLLKQFPVFGLVEFFFSSLTNSLVQPLTSLCL